MALNQKEQDELELLELQEQEYNYQGSKKQPKQSEWSLSAALEGFGQAGTLGYLSNIQAATEPASAALYNLLTGSDVEADPYLKARESYEKRGEVLKQESPKSYYSGMAAGAIGTAPIMPGFKAAQGAGTLAKVGAAARTGAAYGAAVNPENVPGETNPIQPLERLEGAGVGAALGGVLSYGGSKISDLAKGAKNTLAGAEKYLEKTPAGNINEIMAASKRLGIEPIEAMKTSNPAFQKIESGLAQSGSFPAMETRAKYNKLFEGVKGAGEKISELGTPESEFALGKGIKETLEKNIGEMRAPTSELYKDVVPNLQKIPVDTKIVNTVFGGLKKDPIFKTSDGKAFLEEFKNLIIDTPELASLKELRTKLGGMSEGLMGVEKMRFDALRGAVTSIRDNSINAMKLELPKSMHGEIDALINQIALADASHAGNLADINSVKNLIGNRSFGSPGEVTKKLSGMIEGDLASRAGSLDIQSLRNMQAKFPAVFEKAKTAKINDMVQRSTNPVSGFNKNTFVKQYDSMDQELKNLIFDQSMQSHIADLKTVTQAIPTKLGPSGTPEGLMTMDMFSPKRNIQDYLLKKSLNNPQTGQNILRKAGGAFGSIEQGFAPEFMETYKNIPLRLPLKNDGESKNFNELNNKDAMMKKVQGTKYQRVLENAAKNGDAALNAAYYVLSQRDEGFRKILKE